MSFIFIPLYIHYIGIEAYGLIGIFAVLMVWLNLLDMGMTPTLSREMARFTGGSHDASSIRDLLRSVEIIALVIALLIALGVAVSSGWLAESWVESDVLSTPDVQQGFAIMGVVTALRFIEGVYRSCVTGLQRQVLFNVVNSFIAALRGLGAVGVLAWYSPTIHAFFVWQGIVSLLSLIVLAWATYTSMPHSERGGRFSYVAVRGVWSFAGGMMGITLLTLLLTQIDKLLLSKLLSLSDFGRYTLASVTAGGLLMLVGPIRQAWLPRMTQLLSESDQVGFVRTFHQGSQLVTAILGSASIVLMMFSEEFLHLWTQDAELANDVAPLLSLLVLGNLINGLLGIPYLAQLAYGWTSLTVRTNVLAVILIVPLLLWATPRFGALGAAYVWVCLNLGYLFIAMYFMFSKILSEEKLRWYVNDTIQPLAVAAGCALLVRWILPNPVSTIEEVGTLVFASLAVLTVSCLATPLVRQKVFELTGSLNLKAYGTK